MEHEFWTLVRTTGSAPCGLSAVALDLARTSVCVMSRVWDFNSCNKACTMSELRSCVKVVVAVPGSPSLAVLVVSVDVKQH